MFIVLVLLLASVLNIKFQGGVARGGGGHIPGIGYTSSVAAESRYPFTHHMTHTGNSIFSYMDTFL